MLGPDVQCLAAGGQHGQARAVAQQLRHGAGRLGHLLEVVEHEQHPPIPQPIGELFLQRAIDDLAEPDGTGDRDEHGVRVPGAGQVDEGHAVREAGREVLGDPDRQRRLAGASGSGQRQQANRGVLEAIPDLRELGLTTDQLGGPGRQARPGRTQGGQRREARRQVGVDELEEVLRATEVLQAMLAEVEQAGARRQPLAGKCPGRRRQEDLAAVPGGHDPGGPVDRRTEEVAGPLLGLAGVHAHPHAQRTGLAPMAPAARSRWAARLAVAASTALPNTAIMPSPVVLTTCPPDASMAARRIAS